MQNTQELFHPGFNLPDGNMPYDKYLGHLKNACFKDIEIQIADHCNLNCSSCNHYSPLAKPHVIDIETYTRYIKELKRIISVDPKLERDFNVTLMGGEPLLHPDILELFRIARELLPNSVIQILSNGLELKNKDQAFFDKCNEYKIYIQFSNYINSKQYNDPEIFDIILHKVNQFEEAKENSGFIYITKHAGFEKLGLNFKHPYNPEYSYSACVSDHVNVIIKDDYIYRCPVEAYRDTLFDYFDIHPELDYNVEKNRIKLSEATYESITQLMKSPSDFCKYCDFLSSGTYPQPWKRSEKELSEWVNEI